MPKEGLFQGDNLAALDQERPPGRHPAILVVIVAGYVEFGFDGSDRIGNRYFLSHYIRPQLFLPVFQAHGKIRPPLRTPPEIEIIAVALRPFVDADGIVIMAVSLEIDHLVVGGFPHQGISQEQGLFAKGKCVVERKREHIGFLKLSGFDRRLSPTMDTPREEEHQQA